MNDKPFLIDVKTLRDRARKRIEEGAVTEGYKANVAAEEFLEHADDMANLLEDLSANS